MVQWHSSVTFSLYAYIMSKRRQIKRKEVRIREALESLPVLEDLYLRMQAMNIDLIDAYLTGWEHSLLMEYFEKERTPLESAVTVSAFSQMWIFGLYELLRTWRQRALDVYEFARELRSLGKTARTAFVSKKKKQIKAAMALAGSEVFYWPPFERAVKDDKYVESIRKAVDQSERLFRRIESLRMSLAKHEIPKSKGSFAMAPGYGRIDMTNGSMYWQVVLQGNEVDIISRRSIADECRELTRDRSHLILPIAIQEKLKAFPKYSYALKKVTVILKNGTEYKNVLVAWLRELIHVNGHEKVPFDADEVVDVRYEAS